MKQALSDIKFANTLILGLTLPRRERSKFLLLASHPL
jgi:hypothetical protein